LCHESKARNVSDMHADAFVRYAGPFQLHDGRIVSVVRAGDSLTVTVQGLDGKPFDLVFRGVAEVKALRPEGMMIYSLTELEAPAPFRRFAFTNWDEEAPELLEVTAASLDRARPTSAWRVASLLRRLR